MLTRRQLIQGAAAGFALAATGLLVPPTLAENAEEARRFTIQLDQTMLRRTNWVLAGTERRYGTQRTLTMSGPLPASVVPGEVVEIWGQTDPGGRSAGYRAVVRGVEQPLPQPPGHAPLHLVRVQPIAPYSSLRTPMRVDALGEWRYVNRLTTVPPPPSYAVHYED